MRTASGPIVILAGVRVLIYISDGFGCVSYCPAGIVKRGIRSLISRNPNAPSVGQRHGSSNVGSIDLLTRHVIDTMRRFRRGAMRVMMWRRKIRRLLRRRATTRAHSQQNYGEQTQV